MVIYVAVTRGQQYAYDGNSMLAVTMNFVNHGTLKTVGALNDTFHNSTPYSPYGIGMSILGIIPFAASKAVGHAPVLIAMVNPVVTASAAVGTYRIGRALGWRASEGLMAAVAFGMLSMALAYTTEYFSESAVAFCIVLMVLGIVRWGQGFPRSALLVGVAAGAALQFRSDSLLTVWIGLAALPLFVPWRTLLGRRDLTQLLAPLLVSVAMLVAYNELRYSKLFVSSYGGSFTTPVGVGLHGLLLASGKSLFVFNPLALLGVVGLGILFLTNRPVAILFAILIGARILFYARWSAWQGGWCWGPRFLLPIVPLLMLAAVMPIRTTRRTSLTGLVTRLTAGLLAAASVAINYLSVRVPYEQWLQTYSATPVLHALGIRSFGSPWQVAADHWFNDTEYNVDYNPIWGDIELVRHRLAEMAPLLWREGYGAVGWLLLIIGFGLVTAAFAGARHPRDTDMQSLLPERPERHFTAGTTT